MKNITGKTAVCFGDSITWYDGHPYNWGKEKGKKAVGYESYLRKAGMVVRNEGISDATIKVIRKRILNTAIREFDYVFINSGANDSRYGIATGRFMEKGSNFDKETFIGCLQDIIEYVQSQKIENIVLMTPVKGWIYAPDGYEYKRCVDGVVEERFADAIIDACALYGCILCDWYHKSGIEKENMSKYMNDPEPPDNTLYTLHPSTEGYRKMAGMLLSCL